MKLLDNGVDIDFVGPLIRQQTTFRTGFTMHHQFSSVFTALLCFMCSMQLMTVPRAQAHSLGNQAAIQKQKEEYDNAKRLQTARQLEEALAKAGKEEALATEISLLENLMNQEMAAISEYSFREKGSLRKSEKDALRESIGRLNDYVVQYTAICTEHYPCDKTTSVKARHLVKRYAPELLGQRP